MCIDYVTVVNDLAILLYRAIDARSLNGLFTFLELRAAGIYALGNPPDLIEEGGPNGIEVELEGNFRAPDFYSLALVNEDVGMAI